MTNYSRTRELFNKELKKSPDLKYKDTFPAGFFGEGAYPPEMVDRFRRLIADTFVIGQKYSKDQPWF